MKDTIINNIKKLLMRDDQVGRECRNNDNFLQLYYIYEYHQSLDVGLNILTDFEDIKFYAENLPSLSEIKRQRAYFQNTKKMYLSDKQIRKAREEKEKKSREEYGKK